MSRYFFRASREQIYVAPPAKILAPLARVPWLRGWREPESVALPTSRRTMNSVQAESDNLAK
jgi:hypothetical protein